MPMPETEMCFSWGPTWRRLGMKAAWLSDLKDEKVLAVDFVRGGPSHLVFKYEKHFRISGGY